MAVIGRVLWEVEVWHLLDFVHQVGSIFSLEGCDLWLNRRFSLWLYRWVGFWLDRRVSLWLDRRLGLWLNRAVNANNFGSGIFDCLNNDDLGVLDDFRVVFHSAVPSGNLLFYGLAELFQDGLPISHQVAH